MYAVGMTVVVSNGCGAAGASLGKASSYTAKAPDGVNRVRSHVLMSTNVV